MHIKYLFLKSFFVGLTILYSPARVLADNSCSKQVIFNEAETTINVEYKQLYDRFQSFFSDFEIGEQSSKPDKAILLPREVAAHFFSYEYEIEKIDPKYDIQENLYAVGKILNYKGLDLYICDYETIRSDEDSYDNHTDGIRILLVVKHESSAKEEGEALKPITYTLNYHYYGEGGEANIYTYFDSDTSLVRYQENSESESATGYQTPIVSIEKNRSVLDASGELELVEVMQCEYSSPFFDQNYLEKEAFSWVHGDAHRVYPSSDEPFELHINPFYFDESKNSLNPSLRLYFYLEKKDQILRTVFQSFLNDTCVERYVVGEEIPVVNANQSTRSEQNVFKSPILIYTSEGAVELLPTGKFVLHP